MELEKLRSEIKQVRADHSRLNRSLLMEVEKNKVPCKFCDFKNVKSMQKKVLPNLLLGKFANSTMYPEPADLKAAFKIFFNPKEEKEDEMVAFEDAYSEGGLMLALMSENVQSQRCRMQREARIELWNLLLQSLLQGDKWRIKALNQNCGEVEARG